MATAQWIKEHTTLFSFRINNDTGLPERIKQTVAADYNGSISKFLVAAVTAFLDRGSNPVSNPVSNTQPTVPTYTPTDPLDIVAEAFFHQPYATLNFHDKGCCDFIADHPIMGPEMVLDAPPEYIKAGIEYMNNPTPVPIYQPKPNNNSKLTEIINTVNAHRAAKDEAFRQSLIEAETLYPDDGDSFFYCDDDDDVHNEVQDYPEKSSEEKEKNC